MMVLLLFPMYDRQTGPAIKWAFENLGHEVYAVDAKQEPGNSYAMSLQISPDLVFCSRTKELTGQIMQIKQRFPNAKTCVWNVDTRHSINEWSHLFPLIRACDYYFVVANKLIPQWQTINPNTHWLPQGLQDEVYDRPGILTEEDRKKYACDVSFAGNHMGHHEMRVSYLKAIEKMGIDFRQWGCLGMPRVYNEEHNKMVALSKINIGCSGWPENGKYSSVRNYKILGAGGFLLELEREGIYELFPPYVIKCYTSPEDLVTKIKYWLDNELDRRRFANAGYKWVHENSTYTDRIKKAINYIWPSKIHGRKK